MKGKETTLKAAETVKNLEMLDEIGLDTSDIYGETKKVVEYREPDNLIAEIRSLTPWFDDPKSKKIEKIIEKDSMDAEKADRLVFAKNKKEQYIKEKQERQRNK